MKLYYAKGACSLAPRIVIHELGLPCEFEAVDLKSKKTATGEDYLTINPKGVVPTLVTDDNQILTENAVIQQYLADNNQASSLLPPIKDFNRYRVLEWLNYIATELHKTCAPLFNSSLPKEIKDKLFIPLLKKKLDYVEKTLEKNRYVAGDHFSLPDAYLCVILFWLGNFKIDIGEWKNLPRYFAELKNRKAVQLAFQEEGFA